MKIDNTIKGNGSKIRVTAAKRLFGWIIYNSQSAVATNEECAKFIYIDIKAPRLAQFSFSYADFSALKVSCVSERNGYFCEKYRK